MAEGEEEPVAIILYEGKCSTMKIDRLLGILNILVNTDRITIQELAERFEVSKRTNFRDLDTLNKSGIPIVTYWGIAGRVSVVEWYKYKKQINKR